MAIPSLPQSLTSFPPDDEKLDMTVSNTSSANSSNTELGTATVKDVSIPSSSNSSDIEVAKRTNFWDGFEDDELPAKTQGKFFRNLRHQIFSLYRRLFSIVFIVNMAILIWVFVKGVTNAQELGQIVIANIFASVLMRQDHVINTFFHVFTAVPSSWPLSIRRVVARVYSIGGIHSGAGVSGLAWLCAFVGVATKEMIRGGKTSVPTVAISYVILTLLLGIVIFAYPKARSTHHEAFERTHRFAGWTTVGLVWAQVIMLINDYREPNQSLRHALVHAAPFWLVVVMTCSIITPWLHLRKVPVRSEVLSNHAVRLHFDYVTTYPGQFTRLSTNPLFEWHSFAGIGVPGEKGYSVIISRAGDWTSKQIAEPPSQIWVRGVPTYGVMRVHTLFRRVVLVGTGSGIAPLMPVLLAKKVPMRLLWTAPKVVDTYGQRLVDSVLEANPEAVVYDTRQHGKPDMVKLTYRMVKEFNAEAVMIISNQKLTEKVVYGMMSRGIPAFGAIWDS